MDQAVIGTFINQLPQAFNQGDPGAAAKRTESENVRLLQEQYRAVARQDFAGAMAFFADDVQFEIYGPKELPFTGKWRGRDEVATALAKNFALLADQRPEIQHLVAQGDTVVLFARESGRFLPTNKPYDIHFVQLFQFRDGKVVLVREVCDDASMRLAAAGS
jgi:ketosteroid isomerase-like protein